MFGCLALDRRPPVVFHNRLHELADIRRFVQSKRPEMVIVYGRRGVGKSALLAEALEGSPYLLYQANTRSLPQQLEDLTAAVQAFAPQEILAGVLTSLDAFLDIVLRLARRASPQPTVVVLDELPYLALADPALPSVMQRWWDQLRRQNPPNLKVFLLGSLVSWMEQQTLVVTGPLHNRRTGQVKLEAMAYADAALFYPSLSSVEKVTAFAIWGGLPSYLAELDPGRDLWDNVRETILVHSGRLADEPGWLRFADLRTDIIYESVLRAVATGSRRPAKIAAAVGKGRADEIMYHLARLCELGLLERVAPIHERDAPRSKNALYRLADQYVAFWYRFVDQSRHLLAMRLYDQALSAIRLQINEYVAVQAFDSVCQQSLWRAFASGQLPAGLEFLDTGAWWKGKNGDSDEIDVVAMDNDHAVLVGECKWSTSPMDMRDLQGLRAALAKASHDLNPIDHPWRALFSRSGFSDDLAALARSPEERLLLFTPDDLYAPDMVETVRG
jgi:AAA+ ATPase superfamily predicted ATPase